jgi:hypothetical protein
MIRPAILIAFALWVLSADQPPYERAVYDSFEDCVTAARAEVDSLKSLTPDVSWQCLPDGDDRRERR